MKKLYIVGNGFDLHHKLNTNYSHYKEYLKSVNRDYVDRFDDFLERYVFVRCNGQVKEIEEWSELETYTKYLYEYNLDEIREEAIMNSELDDDRASYWNDIQYNASVYSRWLNGIRTSFCDWISTIDISSSIKDLEVDKEAVFLNFNYTDTIEKLYGVSEKNIFHIHGDLKSDIIFGNNERQNFKGLLKESFDDDGGDWRVDQAAHILNSALLEIKAYYKDSKRIIKDNQVFFDSISQCEELIFMGFGFGLEDAIYIDEILNHCNNLRKVKMYCHTDEDKEKFIDNFGCYLNRNVDVEFIGW